MHGDDLWQAFNRNGTPASGYPAKLKNPPAGSESFVATAIVWLFRRGEQEIEVLFQKRSQFVDGNPGKWDASAGGHINLKETPVLAAIRETKEEIGANLSPEDLIYILSWRTTGNSNLLQYHYLADFSGRPENFNFSDQEVETLRWIPLSQFDAFISENAKPALQKDKLVLAVLKYWLERFKDGNH